MKKLGINILIVFTGVLAALLLGEAGLRLAGYSNPVFFMADSDLGGAHRPGAEGLFRTEGRAYVRINSDGLRDVEHAIEKMPGVFRIAVLGDSFAEGMQVDLNQLFWKVLEKKLQSCHAFHGKKIEVINFGEASFGTGLELLMLRKKVWKYQPDMVLLAFLTGNDIEDNSKALKHVDYMPYFTLDQHGRLVEDTGFRQTPGFKLRRRLDWLLYSKYVDNLRLFQLAKGVWTAWREKKITRQIKSRAGTAFNEPGMDDRVYLPPATKSRRDAWAVTEQLLLQIRNEVSAREKRFLLVTLSNSIQVYPDAGVRKSFIARLGVPDLWYPDRRIRRFAEANDIEVLTLGPDMADEALRRHVYLHGFANTRMGHGHWNADGHHLAGMLIARYLCRQSGQN